MMNEDMELVREYAARHSEQAFETLVSRHLSLVHSAALRQARDPHLAEEITQTVFIILARKAGSLNPKTILPGWLYRTTRYVSSAALKIQSRRKSREQEAQMQAVIDETQTDTVWEQLSPLLDEGMAELREIDRTALVLRYFQNKSLREVGAALSVDEYTAQKRVARALEKLRAIFSKRGVISTTMVLAGAISAHSVQAAPAALAKSVTTVAILKGAATSGSTLTLIKGALKLMAWTKAKTAIVVGIGVLFVAGTAGIVVKSVLPPGHEIWQEKFDVSVLDGMPSEVKILPSLPSTLQTGLHARGGHDGKGLGLGQSVPDLLEQAYAVQSGELIFAVPAPEGKYDFITSLAGEPTEVANELANREALQREIKRKFSLTGRRAVIETNVLILTVISRNASGLRPAAGELSGQELPGSYSAHHQSIGTLVNYLDHWLRTPVIDETGLSESLDIDFTWESKPSTLEGIRHALLERLGLQLTPARRPLEFVIVEKAN